MKFLFHPQHLAKLAPHKALHAYQVAELELESLGKQGHLLSMSLDCVEWQQRHQHRLLAPMWNSIAHTGQPGMPPEKHHIQLHTQSATPAQILLAPQLPMCTDMAMHTLQILWGQSPYVFHSPTCTVHNSAQTVLLELWENP